MDDLTLAALRGSIAKWRAIVQGHGFDAGCDNCPLCNMFESEDSPDDDDGMHGCFGCPVSNKTRQNSCNGSPYMEWSRVTPRMVIKENGIYKFPGVYADTPKKITAAQAELDFLIGLLPEGVPEIA